MGNNICNVPACEVVEEIYEIDEENIIGEGAMSVVKSCTRRADHKLFAIKILNKLQLSKEELTKVHDEVEIMNQIDHPHCVRMYECYESPEKIYMILEMLSGGELFDRIIAKSYFGEEMAAKIVRDIAAAVNYLHVKNIAHRDLKPENLIYQTEDEDSPVKIADFGLGKIGWHACAPALRTKCGTPGYTAPEILLGQPYDCRVDNWSLGVVLYVLLCGFPPFFHEKESELVRLICEGSYTFPSPFWDDVSEPARDLIQKLLVVDPHKRFTSKDIMNHSWVMGHCSKESFDSKHRTHLLLMQARKKFRRAVNAVMALRRFKRGLDRVMAQSAEIVKVENENEKMKVEKDMKKDKNSARSKDSKRSEGRKKR